MGTYKLSKDAEDDLKRLYRHDAQQFGIDQTDSYFDALFEQFEQLVAEPLRYRAVDEIRPAYRRSVYGAHSIYYRINQDRVEIMRILGRENPDNLI
ncbi:MAG: type II toxin-antitoxin system RelE/ParE family toxin [Rhodospirillales bacterium]|nr:type II toxin-antitoxin system RelE/ParE family toxin [Rhodospirillales bacterium]